MKTKISFWAVILIATISSCVPTEKIYYQVYKAMPSNDLIFKDNALIYEDINCKVSYNLWDDGGNIGFRLFNQWFGKF